MPDIEADAGTIVVVEDDPSIADLECHYLRREGFRVLIADEGAKAIELVERERPRLVVLDVGLSGNLDGLRVCAKLRGFTSVPIIMVTARGEEVDRVLGLEMGADDYLTKPFSPRELVARVKAILRRSDGASGQGQTLQAGSVEVDTSRREARISGRTVELTSQEFDLLTYLTRHPGVALSRRQILDGAWEPGWFGDERTVDVHVRQLRKKLGDALPLDTVWGVGYRLG